MIPLHRFVTCARENPEGCDMLMSLYLDFRSGIVLSQSIHSLDRGRHIIYLPLAYLFSGLRECNVHIGTYRSYTFSRIISLPTTHLWMCLPKTCDCIILHLHFLCFRLCRCPFTLRRPHVSIGVDVCRCTCVYCILAMHMKGNFWPILYYAHSYLRSHLSWTGGVWYMVYNMWQSDMSCTHRTGRGHLVYNIRHTVYRYILTWKVCIIYGRW